MHNISIFYKQKIDKKKQDCDRVILYRNIFPERCAQCVTFFAPDTFLIIHIAMTR